MMVSQPLRTLSRRWQIEILFLEGVAALYHFRNGLGNVMSNIITKIPILSRSYCQVTLLPWPWPLHHRFHCRTMIGNKGARAIAEAVRESNMTLTKLGRSRNRIGSVSAVRLWQKRYLTTRCRGHFVCYKTKYYRCITRASLRIFGAAQHKCEAMQRESNDVFFRRRGPIKPFATNQITSAAASDRRDYIRRFFFLLVDDWTGVSSLWAAHDERKPFAFLYSSK
jgi:hypothetical protein